MTRILNITIVIFLGLTIFLIVTHLEKTKYYFNSETGGERIELFDNGFKCSSHVTRDSENNIKVHLSFHHIETKFKIEKLKITMNDNQLIWIKPYSGMKNWDNPTYDNFQKVPDSLKFLSQKSNPYYAFDHLFQVKNESNIFKLVFEVETKEKGEIINKKIEIISNEKIEIKSWDAHNDITILLIPIFGLISLVLIIIRLTRKLIKKNSA
jgi:hypothetical protein